MTIYFYKVDRKSGNQEYLRLSFSQYLDTGLS